MFLRLLETAERNPQSTLVWAGFGLLGNGIILFFHFVR
jgi:hypothetical protein